MKHLTKMAAVGAASMLGLASAKAADLEVIHWWTSGIELVAVSYFADEFDVRTPQHWIDTAIADGSNSRQTTLFRILGEPLSPTFPVNTKTGMTMLTRR